MSETRHTLDPDATEPVSVSGLVGIEMSLSVPNYFSGGYLWDVTADEAALQVVQRRDPPEDESVPMAERPVGSAPPLVFAVKPLAPGRHTLALELRRPWEGGPKRRIEVNVEAPPPHLFD